MFLMYLIHLIVIYKIEFLDTDYISQKSLTTEPEIRKEQSNKALWVIFFSLSGLYAIK